jgi:hypothetical protein
MYSTLTLGWNNSVNYLNRFDSGSISTVSGD